MLPPLEVAAVVVLLLVIEMVTMEVQEVEHTHKMVDQIARVAQEIPLQHLLLKEKMVVILLVLAYLSEEAGEVILVLVQ
jgi:hypothetical protein